MKEIRLAREAMSVPRPPISTPSRSCSAFPVNPESMTAQGTLLITCESSTPTSISRPETTPLISSRTAGTAERFPTKTKKHMKVRSRA